MRSVVEEMIATNRYPDLARRYLEESRLDRQWPWKQSIDFYGKVVDERGQAVEGAAVEMSWMSWNDLSEERTSKTNMLSYSSGLFALEGQQGKLLSVSVSKAGYYSPPIGWIKSFEYANPLSPTFTGLIHQTRSFFTCAKGARQLTLSHHNVAFHHR